MVNYVVCICKSDIVCTKCVLFCRSLWILYGGLKIMEACPLQFPESSHDGVLDNECSGVGAILRLAFFFDEDSTNF